MSSYRYVVFPRGKQPATDEVRALKELAGLLANQIAWGVCRDDGRLAVAFDQRAFDHAVAIDAGFESLIHKWQSRGCDLLDHLGFVKDSSALRPMASAPRVAPLPFAAESGPAESLRGQKRDPAKSLMAHESVARSLLGVQRTLQRYAALQRLAAVAPYAMMAMAAAATIAMGLYVRDRVMNSGREPRHETIERLAGDSIQDANAQEPSE